MKRAKVIFCDGIDGGGKTYKIQQLLETKDPSFVKFRASHQLGSLFAGQPVNLETSLEHDWRILYDFIMQVVPDGKTVLVDRGFISSYVYSKVLRKTDLTHLLIEYLTLFAPFSEFWIFTREDVKNMKGWEVDVNGEFFNVAHELEQSPIAEKLCRFHKTEDEKFKTNSFLDLGTEIQTGRLDIDHYSRTIAQFISGLSRKDWENGFICLDCDGTVMNPGYPKVDNAGLKDDVISVLNSDGYKDNPILMITGRTRMDVIALSNLQMALGNRLFLIVNNRNMGLSSRVLKSFLISQLMDYSIPFLYLDDREDVMRALFDEDPTAVESFSDMGVYSYVYEPLK